MDESCFAIVRPTNGSSSRILLIGLLKVGEETRTDSQRICIYGRTCFRGNALVLLQELA